MYSPRRRTLPTSKPCLAAAQSAESTFAERGATLVSQIPATPAWVLGDAIALQQLLLNLLLNSAQAMAPGGHASIAVDVDGSECGSWCRTAAAG